VEAATESTDRSGRSRDFTNPCGAEEDIRDEDVALCVYRQTPDQAKLRLSRGATVTPGPLDTGPRDGVDDAVSSYLTNRKMLVVGNEQIPGRV
jgi:hypothetical protein